MITTRASMRISRKYRCRTVRGCLGKNTFLYSFIFFAHLFSSDNSFLAGSKTLNSVTADHDKIVPSQSQKPVNGYRSVNIC
jgi:hypothetical protein